MMIDYAGGVRGIVDVRWHSKVNRDECRIRGTEGEMELTPLNGPDLIYPGVRETLPVHANVHIPLVEHFVDAVLGKTPLLASGASGGSSNTKYQWDIINFDFATSTITPGGHASAFATASGGSTHTGEITVTGHGTFRSNPGKPQDVTGGGKWQTFDGSGTPTGSGEYKVTRFVHFVVAPGSLPDNFTDHSGNKADVRSGLAVLKIAYDDGSDGVLVVSHDSRLDPDHT